MSGLSRACLRLAATAALRGATMAGPAIFDSRMDMVDGLTPDEAKPVIAVYTETDSGNALSHQNGGPPFVPHVDLVLEMTMQVGEYDDATKMMNMGAPATDSELEASLDMLETQAEAALFFSCAPLSLLFQRVAKLVRSKESARFVESKGAARLAVRLITYTIEIDDNGIPQESGLTGFDTLPQPFRDIATAWPEGLKEKHVAAVMARSLAAPHLWPTFKGMTVNAPPSPPPVDPPPAPQPGDPFKPNFVIDFPE